MKLSAKLQLADLSSIVLDHAYRKLKGIKDGMSHSILIAECAGRPQKYEKGKFIPSNGNLLERQLGASRHESHISARPMINLVNGGGNEGSEIYSFHTGGGLFVFGDASVRYIREEIDE